ncbi:HD domain-containing protein [Pedobacter mendelii]|uniref:HD/PDEase domain-containing protein n=2 Tax=Pedobacter mendelii TaxID=1908240 RepID=A0ABQ2BGV5_9SPHI|nr:hypothetical protein GCM10008119_17230 [Pedobacter mendelii]
MLNNINFSLSTDLMDILAAYQIGLLALMRKVTREANLFVDKLLNEKLPLSMYFHNFRHTLLVLKAVTEIGNHSGLTDTEKYTLKLSALFHDVGYTQTYMGHEDASIQIAYDFLKGENVIEEIIDSVCNCINATKFPQKPDNMLGMIICDADFYHFSLVDYPIYAENLKKNGKKIWGLFTQQNNGICLT